MYLPIKIRIYSNCSTDVIFLTCDSLFVCKTNCHICVTRGVRQGSIISPWMFNCFYRDMVKTINDMECGLIIVNNRYNVICYADDLLLTSATSTGLQTLVNSCQYVEEHGLCFNPTNTSCTVIGKSPPFTTEATFYIDPPIGREIAECKDLQMPWGGARQSIALRACETANPSNKRCLS